MSNLSVVGVSIQTVLNLLLPLVTVGQQLLLVIEELLSGLCGVFHVGSLDNGVNRAGLLAVAAENALGHVDIVLGGTTRAISTLLSINGNSHGGANSFTQLACDTSLLARGISAESVLTTETRGDWALFKRIVDGIGSTEVLLQDNVHATEHFC